MATEEPTPIMATDEEPTPTTTLRTVSLQFQRLYSRDAAQGDISPAILCCVTSCTCCLYSIGAILSYGVFVCFNLLVLFIAFRASAKSPRFYLSDFHVPPVNANISAATAAFITCQFDIRNRATLIDAHYDEFLVSVSHTASGGAKVTSDIPSFHQEPYGVDRRKVNIQLPADFTSGRAAAAIRQVAGEAEVFHVDLETKFRYMSLWRSGRHAVSVGADVQVDENGAMLSHEKILLQSSGAPHRIAGSAVAAATAAITVLLFLI